MPELYLKIRELFLEGKMEQAREIQNECCRIIYKMCSAKGNMYAVIKAILRKQGGPDCGGVRLPLAALTEADHCQILLRGVPLPCEFMNARTTAP